MITITHRLKPRPIRGVWRGPDREVIFKAAEEGPAQLAAVIALRLGGAATWGSITGTLSGQADLQAALDGKQAAGAYAPTVHTHAQADITGLVAALAGKAASVHGHVIADTTGLQAALDGKQAAGSYAPTVHTHAQADITGLVAALAAKSDAGHGHAQADITGLVAALAGKAASVHGHVIADTTGLQTALDGKQAAGSYAPTVHTHVQADITGLVAALAAKSDTGHGHAQADITGLVSALAGKAESVHTHVIADTTGLQTALDSKQAAGSYAPTVHTHIIADITGLVAALAAKSDTGHGHANVVAAGTAGFMTGADKAKLDGIAAGATVNAADATLLARANHTGTQTAATISDFAESVDDRVAAFLVAGTNITLSHNDAANTLTINASGGGGGGGTPGGASGEVQFNDGGAFAGAANVEIDGGNLKLVSTADPAPPTGGLLLYSKSVAGRHLPKIIGPSGIDTVLQAGLHGNSVFMLSPSSGTGAPTVLGGTLTTAATMSLQQTIASANPWLATSRKRFQTSTTAGNLSGVRTAYAQWWRGSAAGFGGFFFRTQFGHNINLNGSQLFVGLCASTGAMTADPSTLLNMIGMGYDAADANTGNWFLMRNDGSGAATKVDLGANAARANVSHGYDLIIFCPPGAASEIFVRIVNIHTGVVVLDTSYSTDLPAVNTAMAFKGEVRNGAVAAAANLEIAKVYIETDY